MKTSPSLLLLSILSPTRFLYSHSYKIEDLTSHVSPCAPISHQVLCLSTTSKDYLHLPLLYPRGYHLVPTQRRWVTEQLPGWPSDPYRSPHFNPLSPFTKDSSAWISRSLCHSTAQKSSMAQIAPGVPLQKWILRTVLEFINLSHTQKIT